jgi:tight adherence protein B
LAAILGLLTYARTENLVFGLLVSVLAGLSPLLYVRMRRRRRLRDFEEQLPDALSVIARSLKAGLPFTESIKMVSTEMDGPVAEEFGRVFAELNYGGDVRSALFGLLERTPSVAVMAVVTAVLIERETGGNLADVLDRIGNLIRQRFRFQRSVRTLTSEGRSTAWVASVAPFAVAAIVELSKPGWITDFVADPTGEELFLGAFALMIIGIVWLKRLVNIDV